MSTNNFFSEDIPAEYAMSLLQLMEKRGVSYEKVLKGVGIRIAHLMQDQRLSAEQDAALLSNAVRLGEHDRSIGCELGLCTTLTMHGFLGYGLMSCATLGEALALWAEFLKLRTASASIRIESFGGVAQIQISDLCPQLAMRDVAMDRLVAMTARLCQQVTGRPLEDMEIWIAGDRPSSISGHDKYLTHAKIFSALHHINMPSSYLDIALPEANQGMLKKVRLQCREESQRLLEPENLAIRIRDHLQSHHEGYPSLEATAKSLHVSSRTLKRKLQQQGFNYRSLLDEVRKHEVLRDVTNSALSMDIIATRAGYADPANLTRAVRRWTGHAPSRYRAEFGASATF